MVVCLGHGLVQSLNRVAVNGVWRRGEVVRKRLRGVVKRLPQKLAAAFNALPLVRDLRCAAHWRLG